MSSADRQIERLGQGILIPLILKEVLEGPTRGCASSLARVISRRIGPPDLTLLLTSLSDDVAAAMAIRLEAVTPQRSPRMDRR
jgi:hypothetical protein